jgi:tetratricopeptide (TPR) repeat protein
MLLPACASLQKDLLVNGQKDQLEMNLLKLETAIVPFEAMGGAEARRQQAELAAVRHMVSEVEKEASADNDYLGRLAAWSGRLAILEGRYSEAQRLYRQSLQLSPGNTASIILGIRLEGDPQTRLELVERELALVSPKTFSTGIGELQIEKGRSLAELRRFAEAVGAYDAAFASGLDNVYRESYREARDRAWELRSADASAGVLEILERGGLTWKDSVTLAKKETQLLRFLSGGRELSDAELFNRLLERAFIPYTQDVQIIDWPSAKPKPEDPVLRSGAAWLAWHLYAETRADRGALSRYSARYATGANPRSPIADIPPLSPFFDSILGCVETELFSLPDGRNFKPSEPIRAAELLAVLKKIGG